MNNFFKPIMLMMAFACATFSFSNQSFAADSPVFVEDACTIGTVTLLSTSCNGTTDAAGYDAVFRVPVTVTGGTATYNIAITAVLNGMTFNGTLNGVSGDGPHDVTVASITEYGGTFDVSTSLDGDCTASDMNRMIANTRTTCEAGACVDCASGTLTIANTGAAGSPICVDDDGSYQGMNVVSNGAVNDGRTVVFTASSTISLNAGFSANTTAGGTFTATQGTVSCTPLTDPNGEVSRRLVVDSENVEVGVKVTPNPFSSSATIDYHLDTEGEVIIRVFNMKGEPVAVLANGVQVAGQHSVSFDAANLPKGFYYLSLQTSTQQVTEQMVIMR